MNISEELQKMVMGQSGEGNSTNEPITKNEQPTNENQQPTLEGNEPPVDNSQQSADGEQPNANNQGQEAPKKQFASEEVAELNAFLERNPNKTIDDYKKLKTPTSEIDENELLKKYYSEKEGVGEKELAFKMKKVELSARDEDDEFDDFDLDEDERLEREALREKDLRLAREWRDNYVREQLTGEQPNTEKSDFASIEDYQKMLQEQEQQARKSYLETIYNVLPSITDVELDVNGEKVSYVPDEDFRREMKATSENIGSLYERFLNQDGTFKDPKGFITEVALWANPITREKMVQHRIEQAILRDRANQSKVRRNVGFDTGVSVSATESDAEKFRKHYENSKRGSW